MKAKLEYIWLDGSAPTQGAYAARPKFGTTLAALSKNALCGLLMAARPPKPRVTRQIAYSSPSRSFQTQTARMLTWL